jgi:dienelactone hydrolase
MSTTPNMIGAYGDWASRIVSDPPRLSFRNSHFTKLDAWRTEARARYVAALLQPPAAPVPKAKVVRRADTDGLHIEHLEWQLPFGPVTKAIFLKPAGARGKLPAVVGLHDHGGNKYFGARKITRTADDMHPLMKYHQDHYYGGAAWANELAKRGYAVLVHDTFMFASRRVQLADLPGRIRNNLVESDPENSDEIKKFNDFAGGHEHLVAKSLFCAGLTWPGVFVWEDQRALDYLLTRDDVNAAKVGCCGLSGGGLRTVFLTGADPRIQCSVAVGMMTTWRDYLLHKAYTHTWMCYIPQIPRDLDYPEIMGLNCPKPSLVLNNNEDQLFTPPEMHRADDILKAVYAKAGAADKYKASFYPGPHKFDLDMQKEAFAWFDRWLKA